GLGLPWGLGAAQAPLAPVFLVVRALLLAIDGAGEEVRPQTAGDAQGHRDPRREARVRAPARSVRADAETRTGEEPDAPFAVSDADRVVGREGTPRETSDLGGAREQERTISELASLILGVIAEREDAGAPPPVPTGAPA